MAVDEEMAQSLESELRAVLVEAGMGWVVAQVAETVAEGRYVVKPRRGHEKLSPDAPVEIVEKASDTRRGDIGTRPFTAKERLQILAEAAAAALTQAPELEAAIEQELIEEEPEIEAVEFVDEVTGSVRQPRVGRSAPFRRTWAIRS
jgi:hypothetical protein